MTPLAILPALTVQTHSFTAFDEPEERLESPLSCGLRKLLEAPNLENGLKALLAIKDKLPILSLQDQKDLFASFLDATDGLKVHGMPINHRVYDYVYQLAKKEDSTVGGESWGEIHAFDDLDRLQKAIDLAAKETLVAALFEQFLRFESPVAKSKAKTLDESLLSEANKKAIDEFLIVFENDPSSVRRLSLKERLNLIRLESPNFAKYRQEAVEAVANARLHPLFGKPLFALSGTTTQAVHGIKKHNGLVATGQLLKMGDAPLCGEVASGITKRGINQAHLSFVDGEHYATALEYALNQDFVFSKEKALSELNEAFDTFMHQTADKSFLDLLISLKLKFIRARLFADLPQGVVDGMIAVVHATLSDKKMDEECIKFIVGELLPLMETLKPAVLSAKEAELIYGKAHPLILGISELTDEISDKITKVRGTDIRGETSIRGPLLLGEHINFIITTKKSLEAVKELLQDSVPYPILSYEEALYLLAKAPAEF